MKHNIARLFAAACFFSPIGHTNAPAPWPDPETACYNKNEGDHCEGSRSNSTCGYEGITEPSLACAIEQKKASGYLRYPCAYKKEGDVCEAIDQKGICKMSKMLTCKPSSVNTIDPKQQGETEDYYPPGCSNKNSSTGGLLSLFAIPLGILLVLMSRKRPVKS